MKRRTIAVGAAVSGVVVCAGVAYAALSGTVVVPGVAVGAAAGGGSTSCQTVGVTFEIPDPSWDVSLSEYAVADIDYSGVQASCVTLGTADLVLTLTSGGSVLASGSALNMTQASGTINLNQAVSFDDASTATFNFIVRNS
jgi:hypothetical protein